MARKGVKKQSKLAAFFSKAKPAAATYALEDQQKQPDGQGKSEGEDSEKKEEEDEARAELERLRLEKHAVSTACQRRLSLGCGRSSMPPLLLLQMAQRLKASEEEQAQLSASLRALQGKPPVSPTDKLLRKAKALKTPGPAGEARPQSRGSVTFAESPPASAATSPERPNDASNSNGAGAAAEVDISEYLERPIDESFSTSHISEIRAHLAFADEVTAPPRVVSSHSVMLVFCVPSLSLGSASASGSASAYCRCLMC